MIDARQTPPLRKHTPISKEFNDYALQPQRPPSDLYNYLSNSNSISLTKYRHKH